MKYYIYVSDILHSEENILQQIKETIRTNKNNYLSIDYKYISENITAAYVKEAGTKCNYKFKAIIHV